MFFGHFLEFLALLSSSGGEGSWWHMVIDVKEDGAGVHIVTDIMVKGRNNLKARNNLKGSK